APPLSHRSRWHRPQSLSQRGRRKTQRRSAGRSGSTSAPSGLALILYLLPSLNPCHPVTPSSRIYCHPERSEGYHLIPVSAQTLRCDPALQFPQAVSPAKSGTLGSSVRLFFPINVFSAAASLFFSSCQAARASFKPLQIRRYAANDSSEGVKSAPSTSAISTFMLSFTAMKLAVLGVSRIGVVSPASAATFPSSALAATARGSSFGRLISSASRARNSFVCW